jgi:acetylornithine deacetylase
VLREFEDWLDGVIDQHRDAFPARPRLEFAIRWMHPTQIDAGHPLVTTLSQAVTRATGHAPTVKGAPYACDMWALHRTFHMPAVVFGPAGANAHAADEYIDVASTLTFAEALLLFVMDWCGVKDGTMD